MAAARKRAGAKPRGPDKVLAGEMADAADEMFLKSDTFKGFARMAGRGMLNKGQSAAVRRLAGRLYALGKALAAFNNANCHLWEELDKLDYGGKP
jgi:hypothetical protein